MKMKSMAESLESNNKRLDVQSNDNMLMLEKMVPILTRKVEVLEDENIKYRLSFEQSNRVCNQLADDILRLKGDKNDSLYDGSRNDVESMKRTISSQEAKISSLDGHIQYLLKVTSVYTFR